MNISRINKNSRQTTPVSISRSAGFSLFELVVFIISVAIIYAYAANRFAEFPGQAERANFLAVTTQIEAGLNLEVMFGQGIRSTVSAESYVGINPMELLLDTPTNYIGAFDFVDAEQLDRRIWYFDRTREELVYLINDPQDVFLNINGVEVPTDEIRFKVVLAYQEVDQRTGLPVDAISDAESIDPVNIERRMRGVVMRPIFPFKWGATSLRDAVTS